MKVDVTNLSDIERRLTVAIPADEVDTEIDRAYLDLRKKVRLKGFRPGKAPVTMLQRYFRTQVEEDVVSRLVKETYPRALDEIKAQPVSQPKIENGVLEKGKEFSYTAVFEIKPHIGVQHYEGLELEKETFTVTEEKVTEALESLRNSYATLKDVTDRTAQAGDCVVCDVEGTAEGADRPAVSQKDFFLELTGDAFVPGFADALQGLAAGGQKAFSLEVPADNDNQDVAGKTVHFRVLVKALKEKILPVLDDEFARDIGDYGGLAGLKEKLSEELAERGRTQAESRLKEKIFDLLIERNPFEVPKSMVEMQVRNMLLDTRQMLEAQGMKMEDMEQSLGQLVERYRGPAERQVRSALLLGALSSQEGLQATEDDFEKRYQEIAQQYRQDVEAIKRKIERDLILPQILERKALDLIIAKANITEKKQ